MFSQNLYFILSVIGLEMKSDKTYSFARNEVFIKTVNSIYIRTEFNKSTDMGLKHIEEKYYPLPFLKDNRKKKIGLKFSSKIHFLASCTVS